MRSRRDIGALAFIATIMVGGWNAKADYTFGIPLNLGPIVNSSDHDDYPSVTADGLELYFMSYRISGYPYGELYVSTRKTTQDPWGAPENLGPTVNTSGFDGYPCISSDGLELYFVSDRPGPPDGGAIWVTKRATREDEWGEPENIGRFFDEGYEKAPAISSDGLELYLANEGDDDSDLWVISRPSVSDLWGQLRNLGPTVNSSANESGPSISSDGRMLFFTSDRSGGLGDRDLWVARRAQPGDAWGAPVNLGPKIDTKHYTIAPYISADGRTLYFQSGINRGVSNQEIWQVSVDPVVDLNGDGIVDCVDLCLVVDCWGTDEPLCDIAPMPWGDGVVDVQDLTVLGEHLFEGLPDNVIERRISTGSDDTEEALNPSPNLCWSFNYGSDLDLVTDWDYNCGDQVVGMVFRDIDIPRGELIRSAYIEFVCAGPENGTEDAYFLIWGHLTPNSEGFPADYYVIPDRLRTAAKVPWQPDSWDAPGQTIQTADIAPIIQELIDQEGWAPGNAVGIFIGADPDKPPFTGVRSAQSYERSPSAAPLLHIETSTASPPPGQQPEDVNEGGVVL